MFYENSVLGIGKTMKDRKKIKKFPEKQCFCNRTENFLRLTVYFRNYIMNL